MKSKEFVFNSHPEIKDGSHAIFAPSKKLLSRKDFTTEQLEQRIQSDWAAFIGTEIHKVAARMIEEKQSVTKAGVRALIFDQLYQAHVPRQLINPDSYLDTVVPYIKDAIGFDLVPEQILCYHPKLAFGTADAIRYNPVTHELRIHDLKTGKMPASLDQLIEYAAYFFLEYHIKPGDVNTTLCIYQNGEVLTGLPKASDIVPIIDRAVTLVKWYRANYEEE